MEPVYMILGHSAGIAAVQAIREKKPVQEIDIAKLLEILTAQHQVLHASQKRFKN